MVWGGESLEVPEANYKEMAQSAWRAGGGAGIKRRVRLESPAPFKWIISQFNLVFRAVDLRWFSLVNDNIHGPQEEGEQTFFSHLLW